MRHKYRGLTTESFLTEDADFELSRRIPSYLDQIEYFAACYFCKGLDEGFRNAVGWKRADEDMIKKGKVKLFRDDASDGPSRLHCAQGLWMMAPFDDYYIETDARKLVEDYKDIDPLLDEFVPDINTTVLAANIMVMLGIIRTFKKDGELLRAENLGVHAAMEFMKLQYWGKNEPARQGYLVIKGRPASKRKDEYRRERAADFWRVFEPELRKNLFRADIPICKDITKYAQKLIDKYKGDIDSLIKDNEDNSEILNIVEILRHINDPQKKQSRFTTTSITTTSKNSDTWKRQKKLDYKMGPDCN